MGKMLLCAHRIASVPYYIEQMALNVYSLEELCHYLKQNIDLVEPSFMEEELIEWVDGELEMSALATRLKTLSARKDGLADFIAALASGCNYCTKEEVSSMRRALMEFEGKSELECRKIRADRLLQKKRRRSCIMEYRKILELPGVSGEFAGNVWHNLGTAYAGLFFFEEAAACFGKAYQRNGNPLSKSQQEFALQLAKGALPGAGEGGGLTEAEEPPEQVLEQWKEAYVRSCK